MNHAALFHLMALGGLVLLFLMLGVAYGSLGWLLALPLLLPLHGMLFKRRYTFAWASMLVIFYLGWLASEVAAPQVIYWPVYTALAASLACFVGCLMYVRVTRRS